MLNEPTPATPFHGFGTHRPANPLVLSWVNETVQLCDPDQVFWCDGSEAEKEYLLKQAVQRRWAHRQGNGWPYATSYDTHVSKHINV